MRFKFNVHRSSVKPFWAHSLCDTVKKLMKIRGKLVLMISDPVVINDFPWKSGLSSLAPREKP